jgi:hypothetical protein
LRFQQHSGRSKVSQQQAFLCTQQAPLTFEVRVCARNRFCSREYNVGVPQVKMFVVVLSSQSNDAIVQRTAIRETWCAQAFCLNSHASAAFHSPECHFLSVVREFHFYLVGVHPYLCVAHGRHQPPRLERYGSMQR